MSDVTTIGTGTEDIWSLIITLLVIRALLRQYKIFFKYLIFKSKIASENFQTPCGIILFILVRQSLYFGNIM